MVPGLKKYNEICDSFLRYYWKRIDLKIYIYIYLLYLYNIYDILFLSCAFYAMGLPPKPNLAHYYCVGVCGHSVQWKVMEQV